MNEIEKMRVITKINKELGGIAEETFAFLYLCVTEDELKEVVEENVAV